MSPTLAKNALVNTPPTMIWNSKILIQQATTTTRGILTPTATFTVKVKATHRGLAIAVNGCRSISHLTE